MKKTEVWVEEKEEDKEKGEGESEKPDPLISTASSPLHDSISEAKKEVKSPTAALDDLIAALGQLPLSAEEVIAKLRTQVEFLVKVRGVHVKSEFNYLLYLYLVYALCSNIPENLCKMDPCHCIP